MDYGIKVSKEGFDVYTALPKDLIFSSAFPCLKIVKSGKNTYTGATDYTIAHGNTLPVFAKIYDYRNSKYEEVPYTLDSTNIYFSVAAPAGVSSDVYYFICLT